MIRVMKIVAIIPARSGSKGIKFKNIRDICGKPLIYYQLKNALDSALIDKVVLASDCNKILGVGKELFGDAIITIKRPPEISGNNSKTEETLIYVLNQLEESFDIVITLEPTNPLNRTIYIDQCIDKLNYTKCDAVFCAVKDYSFLLNEKASLLLRPMKDKIEPRLRECSNCWVTCVSTLRRTENRLGGAFDYIIIPEEDSHHLDSKSDWIIIEALMKERLLKESNRYYEVRGKSNIYDRRYWKKVVDPDSNERDKTQERNKRVDECCEEINYVNSLEPGKILDVGCGLGFLLSAIDFRWEKYGVELSEYAANYAKKYGNVLLGVLRAAEYESNYFDVVVLYHVVEHFNDPVEELIEIRRILKPNGRLIIGMPDFKCELAKRFGNNFRLLKDETHVSLFGGFDMFRLLTDLFFEIENVSRPFYDTEYFTKDNLLKLFDTSKVSPPTNGNIITFYARKK